MGICAEKRKGTVHVYGNICNIEEIQKIAGIPIDHSFLKIQEGAYGIWLAG